MTRKSPAARAAKKIAAELEESDRAEFDEFPADMDSADESPAQALIITPSAFDYTTLGEHAGFVQTRAAVIKGLLRNTARNIIDAGKALQAVKERLEHGQFSEWIETEFGWSIRSAERYMAVAAKYDSVSYLERFNVTALYQLASPSMPDEVEEAIMDRAAAGEDITPKLVQAVKAQAQPPAVTDADRALILELLDGGPMHRNLVEQLARKQDMDARVLAATLQDLLRAGKIILDSDNRYCLPELPETTRQAEDGRAILAILRAKTESADSFRVQEQAELSQDRFLRALELLVATHQVVREKKDRGFMLSLAPDQPDQAVVLAELNAKFDHDAITVLGRSDQGAGHRAIEVARKLVAAGLWDGHTRIEFDAYALHDKLFSANRAEPSALIPGLDFAISLPAVGAGKLEQECDRILTLLGSGRVRFGELRERSGLSDPRFYSAHHRLLNQGTIRATHEDGTVWVEAVGAPSADSDDPAALILAALHRLDLDEPPFVSQINNEIETLSGRRLHPVALGDVLAELRDAGEIVEIAPGTPGGFPRYALAEKAAVPFKVDVSADQAAEPAQAARQSIFAPRTANDDILFVLSYPAEQMKYFIANWPLEKLQKALQMEADNKNRKATLKVIERAIAALSEPEPSGESTSAPLPGDDFGDLPIRQREMLLAIWHGQPVAKNAATRLALIERGLLYPTHSWTNLKLTLKGSALLGAPVEDEVYEVQDKGHTFQAVKSGNIVTYTILAPLPPDYEQLRTRYQGGPARCVQCGAEHADWTFEQKQFPGYSGTRWVCAPCGISTADDDMQPVAAPAPVTADGESVPGEPEPSPAADSAELPVTPSQHRAFINALFDLASGVTAINSLVYVPDRLRLDTAEIAASRSAIQIVKERIADLGIYLAEVDRTMAALTESLHESSEASAYTQTQQALEKEAERTGV
jgi:hypothetical protein